MHARANVKTNVGGHSSSKPCGWDILPQPTLIYDVAFDYYGRRMATCSSDRLVRVWNYNTRSGTWDISDSYSFVDHASKISWGPPEYGHLLACTSDRSASIWEESVVLSSNNPENACSVISLQAEPAVPTRGRFSKVPSMTNSTVGEVDFEQAVLTQEGSTSRRMTVSAGRKNFPENSTRNMVNGNSAQVNFGDSNTELSKAGPASEEALTDGSGQRDVDPAKFSKNTKSVWLRRVLINCKSSVTDCEFSPPNCGRLQLAICNVEGKVCVFEGQAHDPKNWHLVCELDCGIGSLSALSWCPARLSGPIIACVSNRERSAEHLVLLENSGVETRWKRVVLLNLDAIRYRAQAAACAKTNSDTQTQTFSRFSLIRTRSNTNTLKSDVSLSRADSTLSAKEFSSSPMTASTSKRSDSKLTVGREDAVSSSLSRVDSTASRNRTRTDSQRSTGTCRSASEEDRLYEPVCELPVHDVAFSPNFGRTNQLLALATDKGLRILQLTPISGANFENACSFRPPQLSKLLSNVDSDSDELASRLRAIFSDVTLDPASSEPKSRGSSVVSNAGSSGSHAEVECNVQQDVSRLLSTNCLTEPLSDLLGFAFSTDDDVSRYACECLLDEVSAAGRLVWRVAWNTLGTQLAASREDGRVAMYSTSTDVKTQQWTLTQLIEAASLPHPALVVYEEQVRARQRSATVAALSVNVKKPTNTVHTASQTFSMATTVAARLDAGDTALGSCNQDMIRVDGTDSAAVQSIDIWRYGAYTSTCTK